MTDVRSDLEGAAARNGSVAQAATESEVTGTTEPSSGSLGAIPDKPGRHVTGRRRTWRSGHRWLVLAMWVVAPAALFLCYLRVSQTEPGDSYGAVFTLQAWDMLHGNLLLHGWWLSDVSFYTTELPEYMLVTLVRGVNPDVVHIAAAITYTLLILLVALLAKGRTTGKEAAVRMLIAAGIMVAPQIGNGIFVLLLAPDHLGTCVPVLLAWLILDRARPRWYVPVAVGVLLAWALIADPVVRVTAVLPLVAVCGIRLYQGIIQQRQPLRSRWYEAALIAAGLIGTGVASGVLALITAQGGFSANPVAPLIASVTALPHHLFILLEGLFLLFGADFYGQRIGFLSVLLLLHVVGLVLAASATWVAVRRFGRADLVSQLLAAAILINLAAFLLWSKIGDITTTREMAAVLPFGAVLAARLLSARLAAFRLLPALSVVLCGYLVSLGLVAAHSPRPPDDQQLTAWLGAHHLRYGVGASWLGSVVTVSSAERVELRPVTISHHVLAHSQWESQASWYDPRRHDANFVVLVGNPPSPAMATVRAAFGPPERTYLVGPYTVLTWNKNLLTELH
jgi:hypothetical protein